MAIFMGTVSVIGGIGGILSVVFPAWSILLIIHQSNYYFHCWRYELQLFYKYILMDKEPVNDAIESSEDV